MKSQEVIDRLENIKTHAPLFSFEQYAVEVLDMAIEALQFQQSVVRCGDCIHQYKDERLNGLYCALMSTVNIKIIADNDEYCSAGERRDEE